VRSVTKPTRVRWHDLLMEKDLERQPGSSTAPRLTILHDADLDPRAPVIGRIAVRAVVPRDATLLLLRSRHGAYKFPGGGVGHGEELFAALARELREECGVADLRVGRRFTTAVELSRAKEADHVFEMTSHYYWCSTVNGASVVPQRLDAYEKDLGLAPVWVAPHDAIALNQSLASTSSTVTPWLERDLLVLRAVERCWA
jgi:8-oxo-dGTP diphosphatase